MTTATQRMLAAIRELAPAITARATEIEAGREVPADLVDALRSIGVFRIFRCKFCLPAWCAMSFI